MPMTDVNAKLLSGSNQGASTSGPDVSVLSGGPLEGFRNGMINMAILRVGGTIPDTSTNNTLQTFLEEKVGANYRTVAAFPTIGTAGDTNAGYASGAKSARAYFKVSENATALRYRTVIAGTEHTYNAVDITLHPTTAAPPF